MQILFDIHLCKVEGNELETRNFLPGMILFSGIFECNFKCFQSQTEPDDGNDELPDIQCRGIFSTFLFIPPKGFFGNMATFNYQMGRSVSRAISFFLSSFWLNFGIRIFVENSRIFFLFVVHFCNCL